jgi:hypothetical protein
MNNLNRKTIIQIVVIIVAFGGSGFVLYNGIFKKSPQVPITLSLNGVPAASSMSGMANEKILPYGQSLDISGVLQKQNLSFGAVTYPKLDPNQKIGVPVQLLIQVPSVDNQ